MNENIEVLEDKNENKNIVSLNEVINNNDSKTENQNNEVIGLDRLFDEDEEVIDAYEDDLIQEEKRQKKITKIQIGLMIFLLVFASLVYFFGYNIFEPFIKID